MSWLNLQNIHIRFIQTKLSLIFCLWCTTIKDKQWYWMNSVLNFTSAVCLVHLIPQWQQARLCYLDSTFVARAFEQECVCIFSMTGIRVNQTPNPCSTTLTQWTLLIHIYNHSFLAAPLGFNPATLWEKGRCKSEIFFLLSTVYFFLFPCSSLIFFICFGAINPVPDSFT